MSAQPAFPVSRPLGFWMCTALVVGNTIGMGIFMLPASLAPFGNNAFVGWGISVAGCLALAVVFAELARRLPQANGPFDYIGAGYGERAAFLVTWCYWLSIPVTNATLAVGVVGYAGSVFPPLAEVPPVLLAIALLWLFATINLLGLRAGGGVQLISVLLKLVPLLLAIVIGGALWLGEPAAFRVAPSATPVGLQASLGAATVTLFALLGIESAAVPAGRVRDPARTIPRATIAGTLLVALVYMAVSAVILLLLPQAQLAQSSAPFVDLFDRLQGEGSGRWIAPFVVISGLGALNGWTLLGGELTRGLAGRGLLPMRLAGDNRYGAPQAALLATVAVSSVMALMNYSKSLVDGYTLLSIIVTSASLPLYLGSALTLFRLRRRGELRTLAAALLAAAFALLALVGAGVEPLVWVGVLALLGLVLYEWMRRVPVAVAPQRRSG